jgi:hypothetical protein
LHKAEVQREAVEAIERLGGFAFYDSDPGRANPNTAGRPWILESLVGWGGIDYFENVVEVSLPGDLSDDKLELLERLPWVEDLISGGLQASVTDTGLAHLAGLTRLRQLDLCCAPITDAGLVHLKGMTRLQKLDLSETSITNAGLAHLTGLSSLLELDLSWTRITDAGLVHLGGLKSLQTLCLSKTAIGEAGVLNLKNLKNLQWLDVYDTKVDDFAAQEIWRALPRAEVSFTPIIAQ